MAPVTDTDRAERQELAWSLARAAAVRMNLMLTARTREILSRFHPLEQPLIISEWPTAKQILMACLPDVAEVILDVLAEGFSQKLIHQIGRRCTSRPPNTPSSSCVAASHSSSSAAASPRSPVD